MGSGRSGLYGGGLPTGSYNSAGSSSVGQVDTVEVLHDTHALPMHGKPNSVVQLYKGDVLTKERYYDKNGQPYLEIHYTDHGNAKEHPIVPHEHELSMDHEGELDWGTARRIPK